MITVKINTQLRHQCEGCRWLTHPSWKDPDCKMPYCSNPKSIWYLRTTSCRCDKKEWEDDDEGTAKTVRSD